MWLTPSTRFNQLRREKRDDLFNSKWGVAKYLNPAIGSEARIIRYEGVDVDGVATYSTPASINGDTETFTPSYSLGSMLVRVSRYQVYFQLNDNEVHTP